MPTPKSEALEAARMHPESSLQSGQGSALRAILINGGLGAAKLAAGIFGHSYALIADACESFADVISSGITFVALKKAEAPPDLEHPAGHGRAETLASAVTALVLIAVGALIFYESALSLNEPRKAPNPLTLLVLVPVIVTKEFLFHWMHKRGKIGSLAVVAEAWHQRSDAITSVAALTGIIVAWYGGPAYSHADSWAALAASLWLAATGLYLLGPSLHELMEGSVDPALLAYISGVEREECPGIKGVDKVWVRKLGMRLMVDLHIEVDPDISVAEGHRLSHEVKAKLQAELPQVRDVMVHVEPFDESQPKRPFRIQRGATR